MPGYEIHRPLDTRCPFKLLNFYLRPQTNAGTGNWHEDLEILFFTQGNATVVIGDERFSVEEGDTAVINSNLIHTIIADSFTRYVCLIVSPEFCEKNFVDLKHLHFQSKLRDRELTELGQRLLLEYPNAGRQPPTELSEEDQRLERVLNRRALVMSILSRLYSHGLSDKNTSAEYPLQTGIKRALEFIQSEYTRDISLDEIAEVAEMSKYYFSRAFRRATTYTFVSYVNMLRCEKARIMLVTTSRPMHEICQMCGFSDQSYFSRTFMKTMGITPSDYRKNYSTKSNENEN